MRHIAKPFVLGKSNIKLFGQKIYYDSKYGLAGYQSMLTRHQNMANVGNIQFESIKTVIDCGANVSMMIRENTKDAAIYAFEPIPQTFECLKKNLGHNKGVTLSNLAMSDVRGKATMNFDPKNSVVSKLTAKGRISVSLDTLDHYCKTNNEALVLKGAQRILEETRYIYLEITFRDNKNYTISSLISLLYSDKFNYQLIAYRNYSNQAEGKIEIMDCLLENMMGKTI